MKKMVRNTVLALSSALIFSSCAGSKPSALTADVPDAAHPVAISKVQAPAPEVQAAPQKPSLLSAEMAIIVEARAQLRAQKPIPPPVPEKQDPSFITVLSDGVGGILKPLSLFRDREAAKEAKEIDAFTAGVERSLVNARIEDPTLTDADIDYARRAALADPRAHAAKSVTDGLDLAGGVMNASSIALGPTTLIASNSIEAVLGVGGAIFAPAEEGQRTARVVKVGKNFLENVISIPQDMYGGLTNFGSGLVSYFSGPEDPPKPEEASPPATAPETKPPGPMAQVPTSSGPTARAGARDYGKMKSVAMNAVTADNKGPNEPPPKNSQRKGAFPTVKM